VATSFQLVRLVGYGLNAAAPDHRDATAASDDSIIVWSVQLPSESVQRRCTDHAWLQRQTVPT